MAKSKRIINPSLPPEILSLILARLPAIDLQSFKSVCKSWLTLISSPDFAKLHLHHCNYLSKNPLLIILCKSYLDLHSVNLQDLHSLKSFSFDISYYLNRFRCTSIIGSCNGTILCTCDAFELSPKFNLVLIQPSTMEYRLIPDFQVLEFENEVVGLNYGFGYDSSTNDYKVVTLFKCARFVNWEFTYTSKVMIFSLRKKSWKFVEGNICPDEISCNQNGKLVENHLLHWVFWYPSVEEHRIVSFDVCNEQWGVVPIPDYAEKGGPIDNGVASEIDSVERCYEYDMVDLGVLNGCLCLLTNRYGGTRIGVVDVWIMKEYGVKESWMKVFDVSDLDVTRSLMIAPIAYSKDGNEILLREYNSWYVFWYNFREKRVTNVGFRYVQNYDQVNVCVQSLVPLPSYGQIADK